MAISTEALDAFSTPATSDTRIGELRFTDGVPDAETANTSTTTLTLSAESRRSSTRFRVCRCFRRGFRDAGVADGDVLLFSGLMDSHSLF